jgi:hypothetical protein
MGGAADKRQEHDRNGSDRDKDRDRSKDRDRDRKDGAGERAVELLRRLATEKNKTKHRRDMKLEAVAFAYAKASLWRVRSGIKR